MAMPKESNNALEQVFGEMCGFSLQSSCLIAIEDELGAFRGLLQEPIKVYWNLGYRWAIRGLVLKLRWSLIVILHVDGKPLHC